MSEIETINGPVCKRGCLAFEYVTTVRTLKPELPRMSNGERVRCDIEGCTTSSERSTVHHDCPRAPEKILAWVLDRIGEWTNARWDQHLRNEFGDVAADEAIKMIEHLGVKTYRGR